MAGSPKTQFDIFLSYSRKDNAVPSGKIGWFTALRDHILADHRQFSTEPLKIFFDKEDIRDMDDWRRGLPVRPKRRPDLALFKDGPKTRNPRIGIFEPPTRRRNSSPEKEKAV